MRKYIISIIFMSFVYNNCLAAELELSDIIREARESALLMHNNSTELAAGKTPCPDTQKISSKALKVQTPPAAEQNACEKITAEQGFPIPK